MASCALTEIPAPILLQVVFELPFHSIPCFPIQIDNLLLLQVDSLDNCLVLGARRHWQGKQSCEARRSQHMEKMCVFFIF